MIQRKCAIHWNGNKPEILWVYDSLEEADAELQSQEEKINKEMEPWKAEAKAALDKNEPYRGGGVLVLSELMVKRSAISSLRAAMKHWEK